MSTTATTRLEAVNIMLSVLGESPVNTLAGNASATVAMAQTILDETDKEVQSEGWHFNTEKDVELVADRDGFIFVPANIIRLDIPTGLFPAQDITVRSGKVYDKVKHTFVFLAPIKFEVVYLFDFEELPESIRAYILSRAARKLQDRVLGAQEHHSYNMRDEAQARARAMNFESDTADYTVFDNSDTARVIDRMYPQRGNI